MDYSGTQYVKLWVNTIIQIQVLMQNDLDTRYSNQIVVGGDFKFGAREGEYFFFETFHLQINQIALSVKVLNGKFYIKILCEIEAILGSGVGKENPNV